MSVCGQVRTAKRGGEPIDRVRQLLDWAAGDAWPARTIRLLAAAAASWFFVITGFLGVLVLRQGLFGGVVLCLFGCQPSSPSILAALVGLAIVLVSAGLILTLFAVAWRPRAARRLVTGPERRQALRRLYSRP